MVEFQGLDLPALGIDPSILSGSFDPNTMAFTPGPTGAAGLAQLQQMAQSPEIQKTVSEAPLFNYSALKGGEPQLMPAGGQYSTPYYAAYTNDNDFAGAVMAGEGQKVRIMDPRNGDVIYEGVGPEGAKQATAIANSVSQSEGRKASWHIQVGDGENWTSVASDRYDPKKQGFLGKLADIALPILGAVLAPMTGGMRAAMAAGLGAAGGSALSSAAQGRSLKDTLLRATLSGVGAGVVGPAAGRVLGGTSIIPGSDQVFSAGMSLDAMSPWVAEGLSSTLPSFGGGVAGGLASAASSPALGNLVGELVVKGMSPAAANAVAQKALVASLGAAGGSAVGGALSSTPAPQTTQSPDEISELVVERAKNALPTPALDVALPAAAGAAAGAAASPTLLKAIQSGDPKQVGDWVKANPLQAAALGLTVAGGIFGGSQQGGQYGAPAGAGAAGTRSSLGSVYGAQLPTANMPGLPAGGQRQAADMSGVDWLRYGFGPERKFYQNFAVGGYAEGGEPEPRRSFAVIGDGDGREDKIHAKLSDGEYVIDAETVALLGNGSSRAGAAKLDQFRVNVRKHKGRGLAKGKFSVNAKAPEAYLKGGRV